MRKPKIYPKSLVNYFFSIYNIDGIEMSMKIKTNENTEMIENTVNKQSKQKRRKAK